MLCWIFCCTVFHLFLQLVFQSVLGAIVRLWVLWSIWWPTFICERWFVAVLMLCTEKLIKHAVKVETFTRWVLLRQNRSSSQYCGSIYIQHYFFHVWISRFFGPVFVYEIIGKCAESPSQVAISDIKHFATCNQVWRNYHCVVFFHVCMSAFACSHVVSI